MGKNEKIEQGMHNAIGQDPLTSAQLALSSGQIYPSFIAQDDTRWCGTPLGSKLSQLSLLPASYAPSTSSLAGRHERLKCLWLNASPGQPQPKT